MNPTSRPAAADLSRPTRAAGGATWWRASWPSKGDTLDGAKRYVGMDLVADAVLKAKFDDLAVYYKDQEIRDELRNRLKLELLNVPTTTRIMLIAHSMGAIIAYDVLRDIGRDNPSFQVDHLITIGSPLGLPHVKNRIYQENHLVRTPTVVQRWTNFADRRDPVAFDVHLSDDYAPRAARSHVRPPGSARSSKPMGMSTAMGAGFSGRLTTSEKLLQRTSRASERT